MLRIPAIHCVTATAGAEVYQSGLKAAEAVPFLLGGHDPRSQNWKNLPQSLRSIYEVLQRKTAKSRREAVKRYARNRMAPGATWIGGFPSLVVGMPLPQTFEGLTDDTPKAGVLRVSLSTKTPNILLDGLGRLTGVLDLMDDETQPDNIRDWAANTVIPLTIFAAKAGETLTYEELGQLFHDFNALSTPVAKGQAVDLDKSDLYIRAATEVGRLEIIADHGGSDERAVSIPKSGKVWTTKTVLLKAVRAAADGPGSHVDHIRDTIEDAYLDSPDAQLELVNRFDNALTVFVAELPGAEVPEPPTLLRSATWWVAFGLVLHDLYGRRYDGARVSAEAAERMIRRLAKVDWSLGNPDFSFLGTSVEEKATGKRPVDDQGRPAINRFYGGSKAYYNLAAFMRNRIGLHEIVDYGDDYGASIAIGDNGAVVAAE